MNEITQTEGFSSTNNFELRKLMTLAILTGSTMLKYGAETYRVEDTVKRICKSRMEVNFAHVFVVPSAIFVSLDHNGELISYLKRVSTSSMDLNMVHLVNDFSRSFVNSHMQIDDGIKEIKRIQKVNIYDPIERITFASLVSSSFTGLFNGRIIDIIASFIITFITMSIVQYISKYKFISFIDNFIAGLSTAFLTYLASKFNLIHNMDTIVISAIMPLLPGYALTNAIRDAISGDHISSLSRGLDAILAGLAIALGVGLVLRFI